jgi:transcriptional regulator with XRE-family HTH domain
LLRFWVFCFGRTIRLELLDVCRTDDVRSGKMNYIAVPMIVDGSSGPAILQELAEKFTVSRIAILKHLNVLEHAGLISRTIDGRMRRCALTVAPLGELELWLKDRQSVWSTAPKREVERGRIPSRGTFAEQLRTRRHSLGLIQRDAAAKIGVALSTIRSWEQGKSGTAICSNPAITRFLGYDPFATQAKTIGERLMAKRRSLGWSQEKTAKTLGVDQSMVARWEAGRAVMDPKNRIKLARFLGLSEGDVVRGYGARWRRTSVRESAPIDNS